MKNINFFATILMMVFAWNTLKAQTKPDWTVNALDYNYSMSFVGIVYVNKVEMGDVNSMVAAFVGNSVRGVANPQFDAKTGNWTFYMLCYGNTDGETLTFKYYNDTDKQITEFSETQKFKADAVIGSPFDPIIWANPALEGGRMLSFSLADQTYSNIAGNHINIIVKDDADITAQVATFEVSPGALVTVGDEIQVSGVTKNDFTSPISYTVTSAKRDSVNVYVVSVINNDLKVLKASEIISPNNDGINDYWVIQDVEKYRESNFYIYTHTGQLVYESVGYNNDWDGTYKGMELPIGVYYYVIKDAKCSDCKLSGAISLVK